jgi:hypothetical protein
MSIIDAIPATWRRKLGHDQHHPIDPRNETIFINFFPFPKPLSLLKSKELYFYLNERVKTEAPCIAKWSSQYNASYSIEQWKFLFTLAKSVTNDSKVIILQYKILHKTYASNSTIALFDKSVNSLCKLCKVKDNTIHQFVDCVKVEAFWNEFLEWIYCIDNSIQHLSTADIIFGLISLKMYVTNLCILLAKYYIHINRSCSRIVFNDFLTYLSNTVHVYLNTAEKIKDETLIRRLKDLLSKC